MKKKCYICNSIKDINEFYKNQTRCKSCTKQYALNNKGKIKEYKNKYRQDNKELLSEKDKHYYLENKHSIRYKQKNYYSENKETIKETQKLYKESNKENIKIYSNKYHTLRRKSDNLFKLKINLRGLIRSSLTNKKFTKKCKTEDILGISFEEFKLYLESKFEYWMNWENKGLYNGELNYGWDIDHIVPLYNAKTENEIIKLNHYTNLQPLCSYTNRHIKMYKIDYK